MTKQKNKTKLQQYKDKLLQETFTKRGIFTPDQETCVKQACECCNDRIVFALSNDDTQFSVGISTILKCLQAAEKEGAVPPIDLDWWNCVKNGCSDGNF